MCHITTMELEVKVSDIRTAKSNQNHAHSELEPAAPPKLQIKSRTDKLRTFCGSAKQRMTCTCTKVTWRIIRVGMSLWQIADMVLDGFQTRKYLNLAIVSRMKKQSYPLMMITILTKSANSAQGRYTNPTHQRPLKNALDKNRRYQTKSTGPTLHSASASGS